MSESGFRSLTLVAQASNSTYPCFQQDVARYGLLHSGNGRLVARRDSQPKLPTALQEFLQSRAEQEDMILLTVSN